MNEMHLKAPWVRTRAAMSEVLLKGTLNAVLTEHQPADQYLQRIFRQDRRIGGRDRRLYADLIFAVFRWFGPLRKYSSDPAFLLAGAAAAEKILDPVFSIFLKDTGLKESEPDKFFLPENPLERLNTFLHQAGIAQCVSEREYLPEWVFPHLDFTPDTDFLRMQQSRPPLWLRVQHGSTEEVCESLRRNGIAAEMHARMESALQIPAAKVNLAGVAAYRQGQVEVQDLSSQCIGAVCAAEPGQYWWDACAGGGGKTLQLATQMQGRGRILATDVRTEKLDEIKRRARSAGFSNIHTRVRDGVLIPGENTFDGVLVDAPCSSSGRWRRNPESRWILTEKRVEELAILQRQILDSAAKAVKPGGVLIYATCSFFRDENRLNVEHFLDANPDFHLEKFDHPLTGQGVPGMVQILPGDGNCDAAFMARFRKSIAQTGTNRGK